MVMDLLADMASANIWAKDKLDRRGYADFLYKVIEAAKVSEAEDNALIFAIDGEWGTGKSFFIDCWIEDLRAKGHLVSRFDAWKNDIVDEPLIGFFSHIYSDIGVWDNKSVVEVGGKKIKQAQKNLLPFAKEIAKGVAIKAVGSLLTEESARDLFKTVVDGSEKVNEEQKKEEQSMSDMLIHRQLQAHHENLKLIEDFKISLSEVAEGIISNNERKQPVFIFIDELDRCRPDYAVRLLEVVKHIFNSKGICFISSVNIAQLQQSIKTIYGSDFKADQYLDRFFNYRLKLPRPSIKSYISSLKEFILIRDEKIRHSASPGSPISHHYENYLDYYGDICSGLNFDLRSIKSIFSKLYLCRSFFIDGDGNFFHDEILFLILCLMKNRSLKSNSSFEVILNNPGVSISGKKYLYLRKHGNKYSPIYTTWDSLFRVFKQIYSKHQSDKNSDVIINEDYDLYVNILRELGSENRSVYEPIKRLQRYVEVCAMSGRLEA